MIQNEFQTKNLEIEKFFPAKFFLGLCRFLAKMDKIVIYDKVKKVLFENVLVGIDLECFKTYLKPKISRSKNFSV